MRQGQFMEIMFKVIALGSSDQLMVFYWARAKTLGPVSQTVVFL